jgi:hypothetical protein
MSLCLLGFFLTACGTTKEVVITEYETIEVVRDRYVEVDAELVEPIPIVKPQNPKADTDTIDLIVALQLQQQAARLCNGKLASIASIKGTSVKGDNDGS